MKNAILTLFFFSLFSGRAFSVPDKEFEAILSNIDRGEERSASIKKLVTFNSRNKQHDQAKTLLAHLYSLEKDWAKSLNTFFVIAPEKRDVNFWLAVLFVLGQDPTLLEKPENKDKAALLVQAIKEHVPKYDKKNVAMMNKILSHIKDSRLTKIYCADLLSKNSTKCQVL